MEISGVLLQIRRFDFEDEKTGKPIRGAKLRLGVNPDDRDAVDTAGFSIQELNMNYDDATRAMNMARELAGCAVSVSVELALGRKPTLRATEIRGI